MNTEYFREMIYEYLKEHLEIRVQHRSEYIGETSIRPIHFKVVQILLENVVISEAPTS